MKDLGLTVDNRLAQRAVDKIPRRALVGINKRIGARPHNKVGQRAPPLSSGDPDSRIE